VPGILAPVVATFDRIEQTWESPRARRSVAALLALVYLGALAAVELSQRGWLPGPLRVRSTHGHFVAVELALYLLLSYEVVGLVLGIAQSVANAAGKQFEIFSLILLRHSFEEFGHLGEPVVWEHARVPVLHMLANGFGALAIFVLLGFYYATQRHRPLTEDAGDRASFVATKKLVALSLLALFAGLAIRAAFQEDPLFFEPFYTVLVLADVLLVFLSLRYSSAYNVVFRNSGLALATVLLRLGLTAPPFLNAALGVAAAAFALALTLAYNRFGPVIGAEAASGHGESPPGGLTSPQPGPTP
jgi:hypothetical protein